MLIRVAWVDQLWNVHILNQNFYPWDHVSIKAFLYYTRLLVNYLELISYYPR